MAIAVVHKTQALGVNLAGAGWTSGSFTADAVSILQVSVNCLDGGGGITIAVSSTPTLTWTKQADASAGSGTLAQSEIWTAPHVAGGSTTVTVVATAGGNFTGDGTGAIVSVDSATGHNTGAPIGLTSTDALNGSHTGTLTYAMGGTPASDSVVFSTISCDGDHGAALVDEGSGWTGLYKNQTGTNGWYRSTTQYKAGAVSNVDYAALNDPYSYASAAIEIKAAAAAATFLPDPKWFQLAPTLAQ